MHLVKLVGHCLLGIVTEISFLIAGRVFSPVLRPHMIGPMHNLAIQNLLEALQASREISNAVQQGHNSLGSESLEELLLSRNRSQTSPRPHQKKPCRKEQDNESIDIRQPVV